LVGISASSWSTNAVLQWLEVQIQTFERGQQAGARVALDRRGRMWPPLTKSVGYHAAFLLDQPSSFISTIETAQTRLENQPTRWIGNPILGCHQPPPPPCFH
jgi:hypothetical protein